MKISIMFTVTYLNMMHKCGADRGCARGRGRRARAPPPGIEDVGEPPHRPGGRGFIAENRRKNAAAWLCWAEGHPGGGLLIEVCASTATAGPGLPSILETRATSRLRLGSPTRIHTQLYRRLREEVTLGWTKRFHICTVDGDIPQLSTDTGNFNSRASDRREERPGHAECRWEDDNGQGSTSTRQQYVYRRNRPDLKARFSTEALLYRRGTQLVVPAVVAEECERR